MKLIYRTTLADPNRTLDSYVKGTGLTNGEIDGNFKVIDLEMATKAPLDSPIFSGIPKVPTASPGTNTMQVASTAFVTNAMSSVGDGTLTVNVSGNGLSGTGTFTANQSGNATITIGSNATSSATASTIMFRDASGNTSVNIIDANEIKVGGSTLFNSSRVLQNLGAAISIAQGGTGATNANAARTNLGSTTVGDAVFTAANAAAARTALNLGNVSIEDIVPITKGGTGATNAAAALTALSARGLTDIYAGDIASGTTNMVTGKIYNITSGATGVVLNLPAADQQGKWVIITSFAASGQVTIGRNGTTIMGLSEDMIIDITGPKAIMLYLTTTGWIIV